MNPQCGHGHSVTRICDGNETMFSFYKLGFKTGSAAQSRLGVIAFTLLIRGRCVFQDRERAGLLFKLRTLCNVRNRPPLRLRDNTPRTDTNRHAQATRLAI
jgi:hypothetical protein